MKKKRVIAAGLLPVLFSLFFFMAGCAVKESIPSRFYVLSPMAAGGETIDEPTSLASRSAVAVGPVELADYLDRPQIVTRTAASEVRLAEFHRWAGSLKSDFARVMVEDLAMRLDAREISVYPRRPGRPADYRLTIDVIRFDGRLGGEVILKARWLLAGGDGEKSAGTTRLVTIRIPCEGADFRAYVLAQSGAVAALADEIAAALIR